MKRKRLSFKLKKTYLPDVLAADLMVNANDTKIVLKLRVSTQKIVTTHFRSPMSRH